MKKLTFGLFSMILCALLCLTSCEGGGLAGSAPSSVAGKTMTTRAFNIHFSSNTSATIEYTYGGQIHFSSIKYQKTGPATATLIIKGLNVVYSEKPEDLNYALIFASPDQGSFSLSGDETGSGTFTLF